ncbi:hypothetical protein BO86DRAFT_400763 [Aspergillus japonicus CBS 114.51]|uniref:Uncharacterized protein n=1 Tax=Aspergillus japonicus CBS 114.51 TaxID=1448312 RepID=A0A8T8WXU3_ASPJA|nr:hypothetical protein BO86DRAFT_400763 [Aspergillus japonicus CBS 114.51]RAH80460.1 hypothetical protein BO86DRAFT_400763 [Aspergillus japonicus CBS 114.51]
MAIPIPLGYLAGALVAFWLAFGAACVLGLVTCAPLAAFGYNMCGDFWYWFYWLFKWIMVTLVVAEVVVRFLRRDYSVLDEWIQSLRVAMFADPLMDYLTHIWFGLGSSCCVGWLFCLFLNLLRRNICDDYEFWAEWLYTWLDVTMYLIVFWAFWHTIMNHDPDLELDGVR